MPRQAILSFTSFAVNCFWLHTTKIGKLIIAIEQDCFEGQTNTLQIHRSSMHIIVGILVGGVWQEDQLCMGERAHVAAGGWASERRSGQGGGGVE